MNFLVTMVAGAALSGSVYMAGWGGPQHPGMISSGDTCEDCGPALQPVSLAATAPAAATIPAGVTDMKNAKCIVEGEDPMGPDVIVTYQGKAYHVCCTGCVATFNADPAKYVKAYEADPAKFGTRK